MHVIIWLVVGGLVGWAASAIMRSQEGLLLNVLVGIIGAVIGGWLLSPFFGASTLDHGGLSASSLLVSLLGSVILLTVISLVGRGIPK